MKEEKFNDENARAESNLDTASNNKQPNEVDEDTIEKKANLIKQMLLKMIFTMICATLTILTQIKIKKEIF